MAGSAIDSFALPSLRVFPKSHYFIHTHLPIGRERSPYMMPSGDDLEILSDLMLIKRAEVGIIAGINYKANVVGYAGFTLSKPLSQKEFSKVWENFNAWVNAQKNFGKEITFVAASEKLKRIFKHHNVNFRRAHIPMSGYRFSRNRGRFLKKRVLSQIKPARPRRIRK